MANKFLSYESLRKQRLLLIGLILALVTVMIWVGVELTASQHTSQVDPELRELAKPMNPTLNTEVLDKIEAYEFISPQQARKVVEDNPIVIVEEENVLRLPSDEATPSATTTDIVSPDSEIEVPPVLPTTEPATAEPGLVQP